MKEQIVLTAEEMMALTEKHARRMARALSGYTLLKVDGVIETEAGGFEIEFVDLRFDETFVIASHFDYWDFLGYFSSHQMWPARSLPRLA